MIEIYTKKDCSQCAKAKSLMKAAGISYTEYMIERDVTRDFVVTKFPNSRMVPIIVVNDHVLSGTEELDGLIQERREDLGKMLLNEA